MQQIRLFVMCDSQVVRRSLSVIFTSSENFEVVGESGCDQYSVSEAQTLQPDAILTKVIPDDNGVKLIGQLKEACPYSKFFIFIDSENNCEAYTSMASEIDGWLSKSMLPRDLVKAVELTCRAGVLCLPGFLKRIIKGHDNHMEEHMSTSEGKNTCVSYGNNGKVKPLLPLTAREMEIYELLLQNHTNKEIGNKLFISQPTVKSHVSSILRKLGLSNRTQLVLYELQNRGAVSSSSLNM